MENKNQTKINQAAEIARRIAVDLEDADPHDTPKYYRLVLTAYLKTLSLKKILEGVKK